METNKVIEEKQSIRYFNDQKVDQKTIEDILNYAIAEISLDEDDPPWHFVVVEDQEIKEKIADMLFYSSEDSVEETCNVIKDCSVLILVFTDYSDEFKLIKTGASLLDYMVNRSRNLGLTTLYIRDIREIQEELQREFFLSEKLSGAVALGYSDHFPSKKLGKSLDKVTEWW